MEDYLPGGLVMVSNNADGRTDCVFTPRQHASRLLAYRLKYRKVHVVLGPEAGLKALELARSDGALHGALVSVELFRAAKEAAAPTLSASKLDQFGATEPEWCPALLP